MMGWRTKEGAYSAKPFIVYPDGKYRDFPVEKNSYGGTVEVVAASSFLDGYALVLKGNLMSSTLVFIDKNGKEVFPALKSKQTGTFGDFNIYPVRENRRVYYNAQLKKYGYADANGNILVTPQFDKARNFSDGMAAVKFKGKWGFIDLTGKFVVEATYNLEPGRFSEGMAPVRIGESDYEYVMSYIDQVGNRLMESKKWTMNEFHNGYAWVGTGCDKLFVIDKNFNEVRNVTDDFYHNGNGFGVCSFSMRSGSVQDKVWGVDFPNGMQMLNQGGIDEGDIFAPDGKLLYHCVDAEGGWVMLHYTPGSDLMFCKVRIKNEPRLQEQDVYLSCFINNKGEIVYYFEEGYEGYEGITPVQVK
jgi:hypothetical protein